MLKKLQVEVTKHKDVSANLLKNIDQVKIELDAFSMRDAKRAAFRCKQQWARSGKISSKYFFNLEKRNNISKTMYATRKNDGTITKDYREILNIQREFFSELYRSDPNLSFNILNETDVRLPENLKNKFEEEVSEAELFDAMMTLKSGKTPGGDGLTIEFY